MVYRIKKVQLGILIAYEEIRSYHNNMQEKMIYLMTKLGVIIMVHKNYDPKYVLFNINLFSK